jgi:hypothetical protein
VAGTVERTLALRLIGDVRGLKPAQRGLGSFTKSVVSWGKALSGALVIGGIERVVGSLGDANKAFREEQDIIRSFNRTVKNLRLPIKATTASMDEMADRAINLGFDDAETIRGLNQFLKLTGDIKDANALMALSFDIARSRGIDHAAAMKIAEGVYRGSARSLKLYGLEGVKGMEAVSKAAAKEKDQAREWARNHPLAVGIGRISDAWADLVGNFVSGDFGKVTKAAGKLGEAIQDALFGGKGSDNIRNSKKAGLVNQVGAWGRKIGDGILKGLAETDWSKTLSDTLNSALTALTTAGANGTLSTLATIGAGIAAAIFAVDLFLTAAKVPFAAANWAVGTAVDIAARGVGTLLGKAMASAMWLVSRLVDAAALTFGTLAKNEKVLGASRGLGASVGGSIISGIVAGMTGVLAIAAISQAITKATTSAEADWVKRSGLPDSPFKWPWQEGGFFFPKNARGTRNWRGGPTWVGEEGPELVNVPRGASITPHRQSMAMAGGGSNYSISVYVAPGGDLVDAGRQMVRAIREYEKRGGASWRN